MNPIETLGALIVAIAIACTLQVSQTYRECRSVYGLSRTFCATVFFR